MKFIEMKFLISGRVQGVGFRHFTKTNARQMGVTGWVRNLPEGDVETLLQGEEKKVLEMAGLLRDGPLTAKVDTLKLVHKEENPQDVKDTFQVIR
ncbi:acylphosphatase [Rhodohalobacter halophilus]|uniref:acylphosphatase n=1 Tax=Rhodohalobacter halophilus TaxID=1812810 RepID=UPI00083F7A90|nr:acylphosphatase [Rhodohalobacter halophilus]